MNQYAMQLQEQWQSVDPARARQVGQEYFRDLGEVAQMQIESLTVELAGRDLPDETYLEKAGRLTNAQMRAAEIVMPDIPRPVDHDEWAHRFEIWQGGHPIRVLLREFHQKMDEIADRTVESPEDGQEQTSDAKSAKTWLRADLERGGLSAEMIEHCYRPIPIAETGVAIWVTPETVDSVIETMIWAQWETLPAILREEAWDSTLDGADYYQATQRLQ